MPSSRPVSVATPPPAADQREPTWGPVFWTFFHTLAEQLQEDQFAARPEVRLDIFRLIQNVCMHLPCRDCRAHATQHMAATQWSDIATKQDLRLFLYFFHEKVSLRKFGGSNGHPRCAFPLHLLEATYRPLRLTLVLDAFCTEMARRVPDMSYIHENTERANAANAVRQWVLDHLDLFAGGAPN